MTHKPWMVRLVVRAGVAKGLLAKGVLAGGLLAGGILSPSSVPVLAQAPAAPAAPAASLPPGTVTDDESGYKIQVPYIDPKKKPAEVGQLRISEGKARTFAWQVLGGALPLNDNKVAFDFYYNKILLPSFTQTHEASLNALPEERQKLFRDHLEKSAPNQDVHRYLVDLIYDAMVPVVQENYHPAVRYNAMLIISGLNDTDTVRVGAARMAPEPMVRALPFIYEQFKKPENTDAIRVAALLGLVRHLEWDNFRGDVSAPTPAINPATRAAILKDLLDLAQQKDPPAGRSVEGHEWFRRRAIDGLTNASYFKVDAEIAAALDAILKDESESIAMRCAAATAVGKIAYQAPVKLDPTPTAKELGYLALLACHKELTRVTEMNKQEYDRLTRLQGGVGGYGGSGGGMGMEGGSGGMMPPRGVPGGTGGEGASVYAGPRPGGTVRPKGPGGAGGSGADTALGSGGGMMMGSGSGMMPGGMMGGAMMGGGSGLSGQKVADPKQYRFDYVRRRIRGQLYAIEVGLVGPEGFQKYLAEQKAATTPALPMNAAAPAAPTTPVTAVPRGVFDQAKDKAEKDYVKQVIDGVVKLARAVEETDTEFVDLDKELRKQMPALEKITKKIAAAAPVAPVSDLPEMPVLPAGPPAAAPRATPPAAAPPAATPPAASPPAAIPPVAPPATPPVAAPTPMPAAVSAP